MFRALVVGVSFVATAATAQTIVPMTCRTTLGAEIPLGAEACVATPSGPRVAVCTRVINLSSWAIGERGCAQPG